MKIAVVSCVAYQDAWDPFLKLFKTFWPHCPYELLFITDKYKPGQSWCRVIADFASQQKEPILLMQEDFFLTSHVQAHLIEHALHELKKQQAAMIRIYPMPGANENYGDSHFGRIAKETEYRVSCQATIWQPAILYEISSHYNTPYEFEVRGSRLSNQLCEPFLAFKREVEPWPIEYICSAISRGKWTKDAIEFCQKMNVHVDTSMRKIRAC